MWESKRSRFKKKDQKYYSIANKLKSQKKTTNKLKFQKKLKSKTTKI